MVVKPGFALDEKTKVGSADTGRELCVQPCFRRDERASPKWAFPKEFAKSVPPAVLRSTLSNRLPSRKRLQPIKIVPTGENLTEPVLLRFCPRRRKRPPIHRQVIYWY
jgi:hypothetical protein